MAFANDMNSGWKRVLELNKSRPSLFNALTDGTVYLGVSNNFRGTKEGSQFFKNLVEEMEWCGIHATFVVHGTAKEYDPMFGNRQLMRELKKSPRLYGVWALMPHHTGEMPPPKDLVKEMSDNGIRAAKMYPRSHRFPFTIDYCGDLLRELERNEILS